MRRITPSLGRRKLKSLTPFDIEAFYGELSDTGSKAGKPLSPKSVRTSFEVNSATRPGPSARSYVQTSDWLLPSRFVQSCLLEKEPSGGYMLCASPRSGSTLLCDMLGRTGVAGAPASYLRPASIAGYATEWRVPVGMDAWDETYLKAIRHHSADGSDCPALRIMWSDMPAVLDRLRTLDPAPSSDKARVQHLLGIEHFVHLRRNDLVAQAVSLVLADQTGLWHQNADGSMHVDRGGGAPVYDQHRIAAELHMLEVEADGWDTWFSSQSISPVRLTYEDLAVSPANALKDVLEAIGRPVRLPLPDPGTARLATQVNDEWVSRFRHQAGG